MGFNLGRFNAVHAPAVALDGFPHVSVRHGRAAHLFQDGISTASENGLIATFTHSKVSYLTGYHRLPGTKFCSKLGMGTPPPKSIGALAGVTMPDLR